jgi:signal transduction histidine kinase
MTPEEVEKFYLTIGTAHRLEEVESIGKGGAPPSYVPTGEKGIGRLSAMRLGQSLEMLTASRTSENSVLVHIDWREFGFNRGKKVEDIPVDVEVKSDRAGGAGTCISIYDLNSDWPEEKVRHLAANHLAKFIDPFPREEALPTSGPPSRRVYLKWNGVPIESAELISKYLDNAQNSMKCRLRIGEAGQGTLETTFVFGEVTTSARKETKRSYTIADFDQVTDSDLQTIGPFEVQMYHYPRNRLAAIPHYASRTEFRRWLDRWSGGLMLFRDGIRVLPYGDVDDDWLGLDGKALRGRGFRVNRIQVVGCVRISRLSNPNLSDQTNREGLRENVAFEFFRKLISRHIQENFVSELDHHLSIEGADVEHLTHQVSGESLQLEACLENLEHATAGKDWVGVRAGNDKLRDCLAAFQTLNVAVERALQQKEINRIQVIELASTGMAAEAMAHELEGIVQTAIATLNQLSLSSEDRRISDSVRHIRSVHQALLIQLRQISPGPAKARRRASEFDLKTVINDAASSYRERLARHSITLGLPADSSRMIVYAVQGHVRQILDNLFRNSLFWVVDSRKRFPGGPRPGIAIECDSVARTLSFSDSGIGVAKEDAEWIFQPFNSRREDGRGLGLYICKELAEFSRIHVSLDLTRLNQWGRSSTFTLQLSEKDATT